MHSALLVSRNDRNPSPQPLRSATVESPTSTIFILCPELSAGPPSHLATAQTRTIRIKEANVVCFISLTISRSEDRALFVKSLGTLLEMKFMGFYRRRICESSRLSAKNIENFTQGVSPKSGGWSCFQPSI